MGSRAATTQPRPRRFLGPSGCRGRRCRGASSRPARPSCANSKSVIAQVCLDWSYGEHKFLRYGRHSRLTSPPEGTENEGVARHLCVVTQCAALIAALVAAPFWHVHPDHSPSGAAKGHAPHHTGQTIHLHVAAHMPPPIHDGVDSFTACHPDETFSLTTFLLEQINRTLAPAAVDEVSIVSSLPATHSKGFFLEQARAHGPPPHSIGFSRAPPA